MGPDIPTDARDELRYLMDEHKHRYLDEIWKRRKAIISPLVRSLPKPKCRPGKSPPVGQEAKSNIAPIKRVK